MHRRAGTPPSEASMFRVKQLLFATTLLSLGSSAFAQAPGPAAGTVSIGNFNYGGSACPGGSVAANISPDAQALTLLFDSWSVDTSESPAPMIAKECRVDLKLV